MSMDASDDTERRKHLALGTDAPVGGLHYRYPRIFGSGKHTDGS